MLQRQVLLLLKVQVEAPQVQFIDFFVVVPVVLLRQVSTFRRAELGGSADGSAP